MTGNLNESLPVPTSALHRLWLTGELSAEIALSQIGLWLRNGFADTEAQQRQRMETNLNSAQKIFHRLAYMRGAMTKIGQAASGFPDIVPAELAAALEGLHFQVPPMHFALVKETFRNEFGKAPEEVFQAFDREAFAAASLGQVHRARLKSGEEVAVKIQYPSIARTVDADFRTLGALLFPMRLSKEWDSLKACFEEIHGMMRQEIDYRREAESLREVGALFHASDRIAVPRVYDEYSTGRVLTMDFLLGRHLSQFLATNPPQEQCDSFGTRMYAAWNTMYDAHMNYADPSPGNYLFLDDGRLGLIDFGCVRRYASEELEIVRLTELLQATNNVSPEFLRRVAQAGEDDLANPEYVRVMTGIANWILEPAVTEGPFDFGNAAHLKEGVSRFAELMRKRYPHGHPTQLYLARSVFGLRAILYRLRARVNVYDLFHEPAARII